MKHDLNARIELPQQPVLQLFLFNLRLFGLKRSANDAVRAVFNAPHQITEGLMVQGRAIRQRGNVFPDQWWIVVVVLEPHPLRFGAQLQEFLQLGLQCCHQSSFRYFVWIKARALKSTLIEL